jgi:alanyl-tRNA synthetase
MTHRLYYNQPYLREFDATVRSVADRDGRTIVTLDRTAFYPTSGGQPFDTGTLGGVPVVEVVDEDDGTIAHVVDTAAATAAGLSPELTLHGSIDWERRFDHMQQHTGQHVLSAAFDRLLGVRTVSFHLGAASATIDLAREVSTADVAAVETAANRIVWEDREVTIRYADAEEAARLPLRKESLREGTLRLIEVHDCDLSACGGTHVARTGAIGIIAVASWERFKGGQRIEFVCGGRALSRWRALREATGASVRLLSVLHAELPAAIERLQAEAKEQKRAAAALTADLVRYRAEELALTADAIAPETEPSASADARPPILRVPALVRVVARTVDADAAALKALAAAIATRPGFAVVLLSESKPALVVVARSADVPVSASTVLGVLTARFGGRGGGKPDLAQGGGLDASSEAILAAARAAILSAIRSR